MRLVYFAKTTLKRLLCTKILKSEQRKFLIMTQISKRIAEQDLNKCLMPTQKRDDEVCVLYMVQYLMKETTEFTNP